MCPTARLGRASSFNAAQTAERTMRVPLGRPAALVLAANWKVFATKIGIGSCLNAVSRTFRDRLHGFIPRKSKPKEDLKTDWPIRCKCPLTSGATAMWHVAVAMSRLIWYTPMSQSHILKSTRLARVLERSEGQKLTSLGVRHKIIYIPIGI